MTDRPAGWVRLTSRTIRQRMGDGALAVAPNLIFAILLVQFGDVVFGALEPALAIALTLVSIMVMAALVVVVYTVVNPIAHANFTTRQLRIRGRLLRFEEIDTAMIVIAQPTAKHRSIAIRFGKDRGRKTAVTLRVDAELVLSEEERDRIIALLELTSIRMPRSPYDPTGKFARYNFPENLDREAAIDLVRDPPAPMGPLPVIEDGRYRRREG